MAVSQATQAPSRRIGGGPTRSVAAASWTALGALLLRDVVVLRKHLWEFVLRTIIQPFLLCFVFLYVFPKIGQGIGGHGPAAQSAIATSQIGQGAWTRSSISRVKPNSWAMARAMDCTPWNMTEMPTTPGTRIVAKADCCTGPRPPMPCPIFGNT